MYRRNVFARRSETEKLTAGMEAVDISAAGNNEMEDDFEKGVLIGDQRSDNTNQRSNNNNQHIDNTNQRAGQKSRGIVGDTAGAVVSSFCGGFMDKVLMVISTILGVLVICGGGLLAYQGTAATVGFNYVLWAFAAIEFIAGIYIIFRTFSLASAMAQLRKINSEFEETQEKLEDEVESLRAECKSLQKVSGELQETNVQIGKTAEELTETNLQLKEELAIMQRTNNDLRAINSDLLETTSNLQETTSELKSNLAGLQNINTDLSEQRDRAREVASALSAENAAMKSHITNLGEQISNFAVRNETYQHENANLHAQISRFISLQGEFESQVAALKHERTELALANDKLRTAISALASANDASLDVGKMIAGVLEDMEKERDAITSEREAMERFSLQLSSAIFAEMDLNDDGAIDKSEQSAWLKRIKK